MEKERDDSDLLPVDEARIALAPGKVLCSMDLVAFHLQQIRKAEVRLLSVSDLLPRSVGLLSLRSLRSLIVWLLAATGLPRSESHWCNLLL
jgi:hypothetical protein